MINNTDTSIFFSLRIVNEHSQFDLGLNTKNSEIPEMTKKIIEQRMQGVCKEYLMSRFENELREIPTEKEREQQRRILSVTLGANFFEDVARKGVDFFRSHFLNCSTEMTYEIGRERLMDFLFKEEKKAGEIILRHNQNVGDNYRRATRALERLRNKHAKRDDKREMVKFARSNCFRSFDDVRDYLGCCFQKHGSLFLSSVEFSGGMKQMNFTWRDMKDFAATHEETLVAEQETSLREAEAEKAFQELLNESSNSNTMASRTHSTPKKKGSKKKKRVSKKTTSQRIIKKDCQPSPLRKKSDASSASNRLIEKGPNLLDLEKTTPSGETHFDSDQLVGKRNPSQPIHRSLGQGSYHYHFRVKRWGLTTEGIRKFVDFDEDNNPIYNYKECSEKELEWARCCHYLPGLELALQNLAGSFQYAIPTDRGRALLAKLKKNGEQTSHQGMVYFGIGQEDHVIYHLMFHELSFETLQKSVLSLLKDPDLNPFQEESINEPLQEEDSIHLNGWNIVGNYSAEVDEAGVVTFTYSDKKVSIYPIGPREKNQG